jgi:ATPase family associated with various cellular activities (AAA)
VAAEPDPAELAAALQRLSEWAQRTAPPRHNQFAEVLRGHMGDDFTELPVTTLEVDRYDRANLQVALDELAAERPAEPTVVGVSGRHFEVSLTSLGREDYGPRPGPVDRTLIDLGGGRSLSCVVLGIYLLPGDEPVTVLIGRDQHGFHEGRILVEVMARTPQLGEEFVADLKRLMDERNVFRGRVISLSAREDMPGSALGVAFHEIPSIAREDIVLPDGVLERIERNTITFAEKAEALLRAGRHLRRGLLLHGPPGTGKTLTARYLTSRLAGRTVILLSGAGYGLVSASCGLARKLQPSMVILEDVDLVAQRRTMMGMGETSILFELLNEMDGLDPDADVVFLLTTNRADLLEPALAARPGRIDLAVELPLPDSIGRRRLIEMYCRGLQVEVTDPDEVVRRTKGGSPAFIRELVRKAALAAAEQEVEIVQDAHFAAALSELETGGQLLRRILGAETAAPQAEDWGQPEGGWEEDE